MEELFGTVAEEKEVEKIVVKMHEAKCKKSNELLEIIAKFAGSGVVNRLIAPLKEVTGFCCCCCCCFKSNVPMIRGIIKEIWLHISSSLSLFLVPCSVK